jgi:hypothetical protein
MGKNISNQRWGRWIPPPRLINAEGMTTLGAGVQFLRFYNQSDTGYIMLYHQSQLKGWENSTMIPMTQLIWYLPLPSRREIMNQRLGWWVKLLQGHTSCGFPTLPTTVPKSATSTRLPPVEKSAWKTCNRSCKPFTGWWLTYSSEKYESQLGW